MKCNRHGEVEAVALCRICSLTLCRDCTVAASQGYVCSAACGVRSATIDKTLDLNAAALVGRGRLRRFYGAAFLIVLGAVLVGEHALFGTPSTAPKVFFGFVTLAVGLASALYETFLRRINSANERPPGA